VHVVKDGDDAVLLTRIGRGWLIVPGVAWDAFAAAVKRGEYDRAVR
jgi:hypothetical protein